MASFRSLLLGNQADTDKSKVDQAMAGQGAPIKPATLPPIPAPEPISADTSGVPRLVKARINTILSKNPDDEKSLRQLVSTGASKEEVNNIARPIFERLGIAKFASTVVDPFDFLKATTPSQPGPREFKAELQNDKLRASQIGQIDTEELVTRGLSATGETVLPNVYKPIQKVRTGGKAGGNTPPAVVGTSSFSGSMDMDAFLKRATPEIKSISERTGRPIQAVQDDIKTRIETTREAPAKASDAYSKLLDETISRYKESKTAAVDTDLVGGAKTFESNLDVGSIQKTNPALLGIITKSIGNQAPGSFLRSYLEKPLTDRLNVITRTASDLGGQKFDTQIASDAAKYIEGVATVYTSASGKNRLAIAEGFGNLVTLNGLLSNPVNGVPKNIQDDLMEKAQDMFDGVLRQADQFSAGKQLTSKLIGQDTLANLVRNGLPGFLQNGNTYADFARNKTKNKELLPWADDASISVKELTRRFTGEVMGAARAITLKRIGEDFDKKYAGTTIGGKQQAVLGLVEALFKAKSPFMAALEENVGELAERGLLSQTLGSGNQSAIKLMESMKTGAQVGKAGALIDPLSGKPVSGPAVAAAQRLDVANAVEQITKLDWFGSGTDQDPNSASARAMEARVKQATTALLQYPPDWGMFAKKISPYATPEQLRLMLPGFAEKTFASSPYRLLEKDASGKPIARNYEKVGILQDALVRNLARLTRAQITTTDNGDIQIKGKGIEGKFLLNDAISQLKTPKVEELINSRFKALVSQNPELAAANKKSPYGFNAKLLAIASNPGSATPKFWGDLMGLAPKDSQLLSVFKNMRGGKVSDETVIVSDKNLPERLKQRRALLDVQSELIKEAKRTELNVDVPETVLNFVRGYKTFGISPYVIGADGRTTTGYAPEGLIEKINANPDAWNQYVKDAGRLSVAYSRKQLTDGLVGTSVRTAIQGLGVDRVAGMIEYGKADKAVNFKELVKILRSIPEQSKKLLGDGISTKGKTDGLVAGIDGILKGLRNGNVLPKQLTGAEGAGRSQVIEQPALFDVARQAIDVMAERLGPNSKAFLFWNPEFKKKYEAIEKRDVSGEVKDALHKSALSDFLQDSTRHRGLLSIIANSKSPQAAMDKVMSLQRAVSQALEKSIPKGPAESRARQNPTADIALKNIENKTPSKGAPTGTNGPSGSGYQTNTGETVGSNYVTQQFMGELEPKEWILKVDSDIDRWNASTRKADKVTINESRNIKYVAEQLASGITIDQLTRSPQFDGNRGDLDIALSFLRFTPGSKFDLVKVGKSPLIAGIKPAIQSSTRTKGTVIGDLAEKAKGKGLLARFKKPPALLAPLLAPIIQQTVEKLTGRSSLSKQVRQGNAAKP
jgi:hypothetical protein